MSILETLSASCWYDVALKFLPGGLGRFIPGRVGGKFRLGFATLAGRSLAVTFPAGLGRRLEKAFWVVRFISLGILLGLELLFWMGLLGLSFALLNVSRRKPSSGLLLPGSATHLLTIGGDEVGLVSVEPVRRLSHPGTGCGNCVLVKRVRLTKKKKHPSLFIWASWRFEAASPKGTEEGARTRFIGWGWWHAQMEEAQRSCHTRKRVGHGWDWLRVSGSAHSHASRLQVCTLLQN